jgi:hypothetical protein
VMSFGKPSRMVCGFDTSPDEKVTRTLKSETIPCWASAAVHCRPMPLHPTIDP